MVCPYSNTRNAALAPICSQCGVILRASKADRRAPKVKVPRSKIFRWVGTGIAALIGASASGIMAHVMLHELVVISAIGGGIVGGFLVFVVSAARLLFYTYLYRFRLGQLQVKIKGSLSASEQKATNDLEKNVGGYQPRLALATVRLLQDEVESSLQGFQQLQQLGASELEFHNNAGIANARKGDLQPATDHFNRALLIGENQIEPHANLAHTFTLAVRGGDPKIAETAISEVGITLKLDSSRSDAYNRHGLILVESGNYKESETMFAAAISKGQSSRATQADAHNNLGIAKFLSGDHKSADSEFQTATRLDPAHGRALCNIAVMDLLEGNLEDAVEFLQKSVRLDPKSAPIRSNLGYSLCRTSAVNDGIREFREALRLDPTLFEPNYNLGKAYADENLTEPAERYLKNALRFNPKSWEGLTTYGVVFMQQTKYQQAIQCFETAEKYAPKQTLPMINNGIAKTHTYDLQGAEQHFKDAHTVDPKNNEILAHLAWVHIQQGHVSLAAEELTEALNRDDSVASTNCNYGLCQINLGAYDLALQHFKRALDDDPDLVSCYYHVGYVLALQKKIDLALREWDHTAKSETTFADAFVNRGVAYYQKGNLDQAVIEFRRVISLRQSRMEDYSNLGLSYAKQGVVLRAASRNPKDTKAKEAIDRSRLAIEMFDKALALEPDNVQLHSNRGLACFFANRPEEAMVEWATVTKLDPAYVRRRGSAVQKEYDETAVTFVDIIISERAIQLPARTSDFLYQLSPGYDTDEWDVVVSDKSLEQVPEYIRDARRIERNLQALQL